MRNIKVPAQRSRVSVCPFPNGHHCRHHVAKRDATQENSPCTIQEISAGPGIYLRNRLVLIFALFLLWLRATTSSNAVRVRRVSVVGEGGANTCSFEQTAFSGKKGKQNERSG